MMRIEDTPDPNEAQLNCINAAPADWSTMRLWLACVCLVFWEGLGLGVASLDLHMMNFEDLQKQKKMFNEQEEL